MSTESEFRERLDALYNDARSCAVFAYTELTFHRLASENGLHDHVNSHSEFWTGVLGGLQTSAFITLGRIYDRRRDTNNAGKLVEFAIRNLGIFSHQPLEARKVGEGMTPKDATVYTAETFRPQQSTLNPLREKLLDMQGLYEQRIRPIRNNVFAHAGRLSREERDELFTDLFIRDLEKLVVFPLRLHRALFGLYFNGREPVLPHAPTIVADVLAAGAPPHTNTWEHQHAAAATENFLHFLEWAANKAAR